jgi:hypothetical protein
MPSLRLHERVAEEFITARAWYPERSPLAAENFTQRFEAAKTRVRLRPGSQTPSRAEFRRARLLQFPSLLIFHFALRQISVLALVHANRDANRILSTMRSRIHELS